MKTSVIIRFIILGLLWLLLVYTIIVRSTRIDFFTIFAIVASAIIIFVPVYKRYVKHEDK